VGVYTPFSDLTLVSGQQEGHTEIAFGHLCGTLSDPE